MKKKTGIITLWILTILLILICFACGTRHTVDGGDYEEILKKALLGDIELYYVLDGEVENVVVSDIPSLFDADDSFIKIWNFSVVDMDGDGEEEVILFVVGVSGNTGGKAILHRIGDKVHVYLTDNRALVDIKTDGTWYFSDPTGVNELGIAIITDFSENCYTFDKISYATGTYEGWDAFVVDHQSSTEEEYLEAVSQQDEKQDVECHDFTNENIDALLLQK